MADKESKNLKRLKADPPNPDSPTKGKRDINATMDSVLSKLAEVLDLAKSTKEEISAIRQEMKDTNLRLTETENRISQLEDSGTKVSKTLKTLTDTTDSLTKRLSSLEDRNRRGNLRIFGIPEGEEDQAGSCIAFLEQWFAQATNLVFKKPLEFDRAHRVPTRIMPTQRHPRPIVCKPLRYQHVDQILAFMRKNNHILWKGNKIYISQDYSKETVETRKGFLALRPRLRDMHYQFAFAGPAKFRVVIQGTSHFFTDHHQLKRLLDGSDDSAMDFSNHGASASTFKP